MHSFHEHNSLKQIFLVCIQLLFEKIIIFINTTHTSQ